MDSEIALITCLPFGMVLAGVVLLWISAFGRRAGDARVSNWVVLARWAGIGLALIGILVIGTFMTHVMAFVFWVATLAVLTASVHRFLDARRQSLLWVIAVAAERGIPLDQAVRAFAVESNDRVGEQAARLAEYLDAGVPLGLSLQRSGISISPAARLAADLGQHTGTLGPALRRSIGPGDVLETTTRTLVQRLFYLSFLVGYILIVVTFSVTRIIPALARIHEDFGVPLPSPTWTLVDIVDTTAAYWLLSIPMFAIACGILTLALAHYMGFPIRQLPLLRRMWWRADCTLILQWLAAAVRQRRPLAEVIRLLAGYFPHPAIRRRLEKTAARIDRGGHWSVSLQQSGLIRRSDSTLFQAAERAGNLAWALDEMADSSMRRFAYRWQSYLDIAFPIVLIVFGGCVLFLALGIMKPLFNLILSLT